MTSMQQKIRVVPDTLGNLVVAVSKGHYRIPQFQREYVWEKSKVIELFDSIYKEYPVGSFFIWKAGREHNKLFRHSVSLDIPPVRDDEDVSFILDGQQRITSLYVTLLGLTAQGTDYSRVCFDVKDQEFTYREPDGLRYVSVSDIWGERALEVVEAVDKAHKPAFRRCFEVLRTYPVSIVEVRDKDLPAVCRIFQRINQAGKRLDRFDLIAAMTFSPDFDLREKVKQDIIEPLNRKAFGAIPPAIVTQLMALVKKGTCTESAEYSLTGAEITEMWSSIVDAVLLAADTLRKSVGVKNYQYLPYNALLTLLAYCYAKSRQRSLSDEQLGWVSRWFWRASFSLHYGSGGATKIGNDKALFERLLLGELPRFEPPMSITADTLIGTKMKSATSAIRNAFLCLLAERDPVDLANNSRLDLVNGGISDFTNPEKHHIFPQAFLRSRGSGAEEVHALPNFCFLPAELNKRISDTAPSVYFPELDEQNEDFKRAVASQLIPVGAGSGLDVDDYLQFLRARAVLILGEIERVTGRSVVPAPDKRQVAISALEERLRDLIHQTLVDAHGQEYWKRIVPQDIRDEVEKRIEGELRKQPGLKLGHYAHARSKLDYCNVADYAKLILGNQNWPQFEPVFRRKVDVERHMEAFADFRNSIMHNRALNELAQRAGELAIVWLETVMPTAEGQESDGDGFEQRG
jgi:hypothetical protein